MRSLTKVIFITLFGILVWSKSFGQVLIQEVPNSFNQVDTSLGIKGVGYACLSMTMLQDNLPCQPAFLTYTKEPSFTAQITAGNGYTALKTGDQLLNQHVSKEFLKSLFNENQVIEMEAVGDLFFKTKYFGAKFIPYKLNYFSVIRNSAYPTIALHAMQEKTFVFQGAHTIWNDVHLGAQARLVDRKFIHKEFTLFQVLAEDGAATLTPQEQKAVFIEPGVAYVMPIAWKPRASLLWTNLGYVDKTYEVLDTSPQPQFGVGVSPPLKYGTLEVGIDYKKVGPASDTVDQQLFYGAAYTLGATQFTGGFNSQNINGGVSFNLSSVNVGIIYTSTKTFSYGDDQNYAQSVYTQFSFQM